MLKLRVHTPFPPGEFPYQQNYGVGQVHGVEDYSSKTQYFAGDGLSIAQQALRVADFRRGNRLLRASIEEAIQDIDAYTCARLKNDPQFVIDTDAPVYVEPRPSGSCATCGTPQ